MTASSLPKNDFPGREAELSRILSIADPAASPHSGNILMTGPAGIGKTELLRQVYNKVFWESRGISPVLYNFQSALLAPKDFARDYADRFVRQFIAFETRTPSLAEDHWFPLQNLLRESSSQSAGLIQDIISGLEKTISDGTPSQAVMAALSFPPAVADRTGRRLLVLLDDFHLVRDILVSEGCGAWSLFGTQFSNSLYPHVISAHCGSAIEDIASDDSLLGRTHRFNLGPLAEDISFRLLCNLTSSAGTVILKDCRRLMHLLGGNPLYIRSIASSLLNSSRREIAAGDFLEHYAREVTEGETAAFLSSVLRASLPDSRTEALAIELMARHLDNTGGKGTLWDIGNALGLEPDILRAAVAGLEAAGFNVGHTSIRQDDNIALRDFMKSQHLLRIKGDGIEAVRTTLIERHREAALHEESVFRMTIPKESGAEIVAAKALSQICANSGAGPDVCEKLQLALIEACINAMEHSGGYQTEISLAFHLKESAIEITVESDGRFFDPATALREEAEPSSLKGARRGWGLKLIRGIVDEVRTERAGDATRLILVKKINHSEVAK